MNTKVDYLRRLQSELQFFESKKRANGSPFFPFIIADRRKRINKILEQIKNESPI